MPENRDAAPRVLFALFLAIFSAAAGTHVLTPIFPELRSRLSASEAEVRALLSVFTVGYSVSGFVLGALCDVLGRRRVLLSSLLCYSLASAALTLDTTFGQFFALRAFAGLATGGITAAVLAATADLVAYERRGRALSFVLSGSYAAVVIGIPLSAALARIRLGAVFLVLAGLSLASFALLLGGMPEDRRAASGGGPFRAPRAAIRVRGAWAALGVTLLNTLAAFCVMTSLAGHCVERFQSSLTDRSVLFLVMGLFALPGAFAAGFMADRHGKRRSVVWALVGSLVVLPALLLPDSFRGFLVPAAAVAAVQALRQGPFAAILTSLAGDSLRGSLVGWNAAASGIGIAVGGWLGGVAFGRFGLAATIVVASAALLGSLVLFVFFVPDLDRGGAGGQAEGTEEPPGERRRDEKVPQEGTTC